MRQPFFAPRAHAHRNQGKDHGDSSKAFNTTYCKGQHTATISKENSTIVEMAPLNPPK